MLTKFEKIPDHLLEYTDSDMDNEEFADNVNRLFPINDEVNISQSFEILKDNPYNDYDKADMLYILDRVCQAAEKFDINLEEILSESLGGETMSVDKNSPEFREALEAELNLRVKAETDKVMADFVDKDKRATAVKELSIKLSGSEEIVAGLTKEVETLKAEKEDITKSFDTYKNDVETKAKIRSRIDELKAVGMEKEDWAETEEAVAEMSDKVFALYKIQVSETVKAIHGDGKKKYTPEEQKKIDEEEKKKKKDGKNPFAKSSTDDIVNESKAEGTLPNGDDSKENKDFPALTKAFANMRKY